MGAISSLSFEKTEVKLVKLFNTYNFICDDALDAWIKIFSDCGEDGVVAGVWLSGDPLSIFHIYVGRRDGLIMAGSIPKLHLSGS